MASGSDQCVGLIGGCAELKQLFDFPNSMDVAEGIVVRHGTLDDLPTIAKHYAHGDSPWDPFDDVSKLSRIPLDGLLLVEVQGTYAGFLTGSRGAGRTSTGMWTAMPIFRSYTFLSGFA